MYTQPPAHFQQQQQQQQFRAPVRQQLSVGVSSPPSNVMDGHSSNGAATEEAVAPGVRKQFLRTKLCKHFLRGCCLYGDKCTYAHDYQTIQVRPDLRKTKMCQLAMAGKCPYNAGECQFAHSNEDLKATPGLFKTVLCSWWQKGSCDMGDKCRFAHGDHELQQPTAPSGPADVSITPGGGRPQTPQRKEPPRPLSPMPSPFMQPQMQQPGTPPGMGRPTNVFAPPPVESGNAAAVAAQQQQQFTAVLSGSLAAAAQAAAMQQRPTQDPQAYASQQQQQWAVAAAAATAATAAVSSIMGGFEPTPSQLQSLAVMAARSLHQQQAMQQMYSSFSAQQQNALFMQQQASAAMAAQQWRQQSHIQQQQMQQEQIRAVHGTSSEPNMPPAEESVAAMHAPITTPTQERTLSNLSEIGSVPATDLSVTDFGDLPHLPQIRVNSSTSALRSLKGRGHRANSGLMKAFASSPELCTMGSLLGLASQAEPLSTQEEAEFAEFAAMSEFVGTGASSLKPVGGLSGSASFNCFPTFLHSPGHFEEAGRPRAGSDPVLIGDELEDMSSASFLAQLQDLVASQKPSSGH